MTMPTFVDAAVTTFTDLNTLGTGIVNLANLLTGSTTSRQFVPAATAYINTPKPVVTATDTVIRFDAATVNDDYIWAANSNALIVNTPGIYVAAAMVHIDANGAGERFLHILLNGTTVSTNTIAAGSQNGNGSGEGNAFTAMSQPLTLAAGATVYLSVFQSSGSTLNVDITFSGTALSLLRIGA
jgi:hypothetical protein